MSLPDNTASLPFVEVPPFALRALGHRVATFEGFDTFPRPAGVTCITMVSEEVTAVCPVTSQPDQYAVTVMYQPRGQCIESKTMKLYLQSFRNEGIFCEAFAAKIAGDIAAAIDPYSCEVTVVQKARGGISIHAVAAYPSRHLAVSTTDDRVR
jgi:7-cyano-7-deazaguanine reductase